MKAPSKRVKIFCGKFVGNKEGFIKISINDRNVDTDCQQHFPGLDLSGFFCISKMIEIDLTKYDSVKDSFNISCSIEDDSTRTKNKILYKLCKNFCNSFIY
jgi:hypothetical protein